MNRIRCPYCEGSILLGEDGALAVDRHLEACPDYRPERPMSIDDMLAGLGSAFRVGR